MIDLQGVATLEPYFAQEGVDLHAAKAAAIFRVPIQDVTPEMRRVGKVDNFREIYDQSPMILGDFLCLDKH